jgi:hypothetical protein
MRSGGAYSSPDGHPVNAKRSSPTIKHGCPKNLVNTGSTIQGFFLPEKGIMGIPKGKSGGGPSIRVSPDLVKLRNRGIAVELAFVTVLK